MKIIVPIKQVPETKSVRMDATTGTVIREGVQSIVNPLDLYAVELALQLAETHDGETMAVSMGPAKAEDALREVMAMGIDEALLLCDRAFAGSDTWATAYILGAAIKQVGAFDLILCGERATDGDTGQVGPELAAFLELPVATYVNGVNELNKDNMQLTRMIEDGDEQLRIELPALLTVVKEVGVPRLPTLRGKQRARRATIPRLSQDEMTLDTEKIGLRGSPTRVAKIYQPKIMRKCELLTAQDESSTASAAQRCAAFIGGQLHHH